MAIFRVSHNSNYTVISNYHFKEKNMSLKAKGLLSLMLSLPDTWDYTEEGLAKLSSDGITSVKTALKELEEFGYLVRTRARDEKGHLGDAIYDVYEFPTDKKSDSPTLDSPTLENLTLGNLTLENQRQLNTKELNTKNNINKTKNINKAADKVLDSILARFAEYDFSEEVQERILDFYSDKLEAKQTPTNNQLTATLDLLASVPERTQLEAINNSIRGGWKTIYLPSNRTSNQSYVMGTTTESSEAQKDRVKSMETSSNYHTF